MKTKTQPCFLSGLYKKANFLMIFIGKLYILISLFFNNYFLIAYFIIGNTPEQHLLIENNCNFYLIWVRTKQEPRLYIVISVQTLLSAQKTRPLT